MTHTQIVFVDDESEIEGLDAQYKIVETMDLAEEGFAVIVECKDSGQISALNYMAVENYDANLEFNIRMAPTGTDIETQSGEYATIEDVRQLHKAHPAKMGDGAGVTWVVNDSGIDPSHPLFYDGQIAERYNMTNSGGNYGSGHGTAVAGQIARLAPRTELIDLRIFGGTGSTSMTVIVRALEWLVNNTDRYDGVNMSWGTTRRVRALDLIIDRLREKGVRTVVASGNSSDSEGTPSTADKTFSVGSCNKDGAVSSYSTYGPDIPDIMVLGENIHLARADGTEMGRAIDGSYVVASGTSFSAPNQSGFESAYLSANPDTDIESMADDFIETASDITGTNKDGAGLTNVAAAFERRNAEKDDTDTATATVWAFAGADSLFIGQDWLESGKYTLDKETLMEAFDRKI